MAREVITQANLEYEARAEELHKRLVSIVDTNYSELGVGVLDKRVQKALLKVRRDKHIPFNFYAEEIGLSETLERVFSDGVVGIDPEECLALIYNELVSKGVNIQSLSTDERNEVFEKFESQFASTSSAPTIVALSTQAVLPEKSVEKSELRVLDIGAGLGYQSAMLSAVGFSKIYGVEIKPYLVERAQRIVEEEGYEGIQFICGDGRFGYPAEAPYDAIVVAAAVREPEVVETLKSQLKIGGKMVLPEVIARLKEKTVTVDEKSFVIPQDIQVLRLYQRVSDDEFSKVDILPVGFVQLRSWDGVFSHSEVQGY